MSTCFTLFLTIIRKERATGAVTVTRKEVKDPSLQKSRFSVGWENEGKAITTATEVANVAVLMANKKNFCMEVRSRARTDMPIFSYVTRGLFEDLDVLPFNSFYHI